MRIFQSRNPFTREVLRTFDFASESLLETVLSKSAAAFPIWSDQSPQSKAASIMRLSELLQTQKPTLGRLISSEMGKPISQAIGEVQKCAECCDFYAQNAADLLAPISYSLPGYRNLQVCFEPIGPLLLIMPFNFPFWMTFKTAIPHLLAGNTIVLKPAENTPQCAEAISNLMKSAGLGDAFSHLFLSVSQVHQTIADPRIKGVSLTGSIRAGKAVAATAGNQLKKCVLELGGSDPFLVLRDADVAKAAKTAATARLSVSGQVCIAPKRFLVAKEISAEFTEALVAELTRFRLTNPIDPECNFGPLARGDLVEALDAQIQEAIGKGAKVLFGGGKSECHYDPTVLIDVTDDMSVMRQETFGPLFPIRTFSNENEALAIANSSEYGLGAVIFSRDEDRAERLGRQLDAGMVFINDMVKSLVPVPFGGAKASGLGRELGVLGIREFTNAKTLAISQ